MLSNNYICQNPQWLCQNQSKPSGSVLLGMKPHSCYCGDVFIKSTCIVYKLPYYIYKQNALRTYLINLNIL